MSGLTEYQSAAAAQLAGLWLRHDVVSRAVERARELTAADGRARFIYFQGKRFNPGHVFRRTETARISTRSGVAGYGARCAVIRRAGDGVEVQFEVRGAL